MEKHGLACIITLRCWIASLDVESIEIELDILGEMEIERPRETFYRGSTMVNIQVIK